MRRSFYTLLGLATLAAIPAVAAETSLQLVIDLTGDAERRVVKYSCDAASELVSVEYLNAHPNFLALMEVDGEKLIFVSALAASGVRYVSGQYVWWTKGSDASLYDETAGADAEPIATCIEATQTP